MKKRIITLAALAAVGSTCWLASGLETKHNAAVVTPASMDYYMTQDDLHQAVLASIAARGWRTNGTITVFHLGQMTSPTGQKSLLWLRIEDAKP